MTKQKRQSVPHLLTFYTPHRCVVGDTQDLYLGFNEMRSLVSVINKIQSCYKEIENVEKDDSEALNTLGSKLSLLECELLDLIHQDYENHK